ncbi:uncharacterized protein LOC132788298 [Drosophila nasuta]|uniref:uncharacterized protein LOC132788298 n=1 Tax=Drosophila nasuta TaxID=42062 RepID=UPI00295F3AC6|nr:uncharacterized protein LOC132788298 [Drosophila nasuta]
MKFLIVLVALFALAIAAPSDDKTVIVEQSSDVEPNAFKSNLKLSDGTEIESAGQLTNAGTDDEALEVNGRYTYPDPEGKVHTVNYHAGVNGYQPESEDIPIAPTLRDAKSLKMLFKTTVFAVCALLFASLINAAPVSSDGEATVVRNDFDNIGTDGYKYGYETSNGISAQQEGQVVNAGAENESISVRGQFQFTGNDGVVYSVSYVADENGFQPQGAHLPVAPQ